MRATRSGFENKPPTKCDEAVIAVGNGRRRRMRGKSARRHHNAFIKIPIPRVVQRLLKAVIFVAALDNPPQRGSVSNK